MDNHPVGKLELISYFAGDCDEAAQARIAAHAGTCLVCRRILDSLRSEREDFLRAHPFELQNFSKTSGAHAGVFRFPHAYALAATLLLFAGLGLFLRMQQPADIDRIKGPSELVFFVKAEDGTTGKRSNHVYYAGEYIQPVYSCAHANMLILLSIDETGKISTYYPATGDSSIALDKGRDIPLANSILLDEYTGRELFVAVFSRKPLAARNVREKLESAYAKQHDLSALTLDRLGNAEIKTILVTKESVAP